MVYEMHEFINSSSGFPHTQNPLTHSSPLNDEGTGWAGGFEKDEINVK